MQYKDVKKHWNTWAKQFGTSLRATTKSNVIKQLEIFALMRYLSPGSKILDVGCGNGYNAIAFIANRRDIKVLGIDYSKDMIENAKLNAKKLKLPQQKRLDFCVGDAMDLDFKRTFDVVTTNRCIINFTNIEDQLRVIKRITNAIRPGGLFLMLENSQQNYARQNSARKALGLSPRIPPAFNLFLDEKIILPYCSTLGLELLRIDDFSSLHDVILYVMLTAQNPKKEHYDDALVSKAAELTMNLAEHGEGYPFGSFGQNRLYVFKVQKTKTGRGIAS